MPFAYFCLALSMLLVGGNIAIGKLVLEELPVYLFALLRFLIASLVLLPGLALPRVRAGLDGGACRGLFLQAFFGCFLFSLCMLHGVQLTSATSAGIITSATPSNTNPHGNRCERMPLITVAISLPCGAAARSLPIPCTHCTSRFPVAGL